jgi:hypothetical protein
MTAPTPREPRMPDPFVPERRPRPKRAAPEVVWPGSDKPDATNVEADSDPLLLSSYDGRWPRDRSAMSDNPPTKATIIATTILCIGFALMLTLIGIAAIIWAL